MVFIICLLYHKLGENCICSQKISHSYPLLSSFSSTGCLQKLRRSTNKSTHGALRSCSQTCTAAHAQRMQQLRLFTMNTCRYSIVQPLRMIAPLGREHRICYTPRLITQLHTPAETQHRATSAAKTPSITHH